MHAAIYVHFEEAMLDDILTFLLSDDATCILSLLSTSDLQDLKCLTPFNKKKFNLTFSLAHIYNCIFIKLLYSIVCHK